MINTIELKIHFSNANFQGRHIIYVHHFSSVSILNLDVRQRSTFGNSHVFKFSGLLNKYFNNNLYFFRK